MNIHDHTPAVIFHDQLVITSLNFTLSVVSLPTVWISHN